MKYLKIQAGAVAMAKFKCHGFDPALFSCMLGASGGPKWFTLLGLDRYLFGEFFANHAQPLHLIGSSAGAFRFTALAQRDPVAAIERFAQHYSTLTYSKNPSNQELSDKGYLMVDDVLGEHGLSEILTNDSVHLKMITAKTNGFQAFDSTPLQLLGLAKGYGLNRLGRRHLARQYHRVVFGTELDQFILDDPANIPTTNVALSKENLVPALLASGSIPLLFPGVKAIAGAPQGTYRDGGIIDYHFDFKLKVKGHQHNLVLFPHFTDKPRAGWFDKKLARTPQAQSYENVVLLSPTPEFIDSLPYQKIPDRDDFTNLDAATRLDYWQQVLAKSELLADELRQVVASGDIDVIEPLQLQ